MKRWPGTETWQVRAPAMLIYVATGSALRVSQSGEGTNADPEGGHTLCSWLWQMRLSKGRGSPEKVPNVMGQGRVGGGVSLL